MQQLTPLLAFIFFVLAVAFIVLSLILLRPRVKHVFDSEMNMQKNFNQGKGVINVNNISKPFSVSGFRSNPVKNAVTYSDAVGTRKFTSTTACNSFQVKNRIRVTSLQVFAGFIGIDSNQAPSRNVAIYDLDTRTLLISNPVSRDDVILDGFYTHLFEDYTQRVLLEPGVNYAICATVYGLGGDYSSMGQINNVQPSTEITITGSAQLINPDNAVGYTDTIQIPDQDDFESFGNNMTFASFQFQNEPALTSLFEVDLASGFATFPPKYIFNLGIEVLPTAVHVYNGICIDKNNTTNIVNDTFGYLIITPTAVGVPNALDVGMLENEQWYAIHIVTSNNSEQLTCAMMSKNQQDPTLPKGYAFNRRIGYCRTRQNGTFWPMTSTGNGQRRRQFYPLPYPIVIASVFSVQMITEHTPIRIPLDFVPPTSTSTTLQIRVTNQNARSVQLFIRQIGETEPQNFFFATPSRTTTTIQRFAIKSAALPHAFEMYASSEYSLGDGVTIEVSVQSFFVDVN